MPCHQSHVRGRGHNRLQNLQLHLFISISGLLIHQVDDNCNRLVLTAKHSIAQHNIAQLSTAQHSTAAGNHASYIMNVHQACSIQCPSSIPGPMAEGTYDETSFASQIQNPKRRIMKVPQSHIYPKAGTTGE